MYSLTVQLIIFSFIGSRFSALIATKLIHMFGLPLLLEPSEHASFFFYFVLGRFVPLNLCPSPLSHAFSPSPSPSLSEREREEGEREAERELVRSWFGGQILTRMYFDTCGTTLIILIIVIFLK